MTAAPPDPAMPARTGRLIEVSDDFLERMAEQANPGYRVTIAWGEPDTEGVYAPTLIVHNWAQLHSEAVSRLQELVWAWEQQEGFEIALGQARSLLQERSAP